MKKHPLSTSRIRSVTFNRFAAENSGNWAEREKQKICNFFFWLFKEKCMDDKKAGRRSGRNLGATSRRRKRNPWDLPWGYLARNSWMSYLRNSETTTKHDIVQFYSSLQAHTIRFFFFFSLSLVPFNSVTIQRTRVALLPYVRSEILFEADLRCVSTLRNKRLLTNSRSCDKLFSEGLAATTR